MINFILKRYQNCYIDIQINDFGNNLKGPQAVKNLSWIFLYDVKYVSMKYEGWWEILILFFRNYSSFLFHISNRVSLLENVVHIHGSTGNLQFLCTSKTIFEQYFHGNITYYIETKYCELKYCQLCGFKHIDLLNI